MPDREPLPFPDLEPLIRVTGRTELKRFPRWPRGMYNGRRIGGFTIKLTVDLLWWYWLPRFDLLAKYSGTPYLHWLCFHIWAEASYEAIGREERR
jgi:hypothetical protein